MDCKKRAQINVWKCPFPKTFQQVTLETVRNTVEVSMTKPLSSLLITVGNLTFEMSLLVIYKILGLLVGTLTTHDMYSLLNRDNLMQQIQMLISKKEKRFLIFFFSIFEICIKFWTFQKKDDHQSLYISKITDCKKLFQINVRK